MPKVDVRLLMEVKKFLEVRAAPPNSFYAPTLRIWLEENEEDFRIEMEGDEGTDKVTVPAREFLDKCYELLGFQKVDPDKRTDALAMAGDPY